ncbi:MAG: response regulator [Thermodesulfovibrionales bacterium]
MSRILLADDDRNFGAVLRSELERDSYKVTLVTDGVEAVMNYIDGGEAYAFVLLDIKMPRLDGINALRIIRKLNPDALAITFSGNAGSGEMAESVRAGAIRCLTKPFGIEQLKEDLKKYLARQTEA